MGFLDLLAKGKEILDQLDDLIPGDVICEGCKRPFDKDEIRRGKCITCRNEE